MGCGASRIPGCGTSTQAHEAKEILPKRTLTKRGSSGILPDPSSPTTISPQDYDVSYHERRHQAEIQALKDLRKKLEEDRMRTIFSSQAHHQ